MNEGAERLKSALAGRYRLEREVGQGGMATVYLAEDLKHRRRVAIKVLRPELGAAPGSVRFLREIETTANLRHPHILPLFDSGQVHVPPSAPGAAAEDLLFFVMPYVQGETLRARLDRESQLPLEDALQIAREVADALSYAHAQGVIHRDIKPANVLLESGHAVVADFGISRALDAASGDRLTEARLSLGTPAYMSPEQVTGGDALDGRSDIYSLGCMLYEMLAGGAPFAGGSQQAVMARHVVDTTPDVRTVRETVPPALAAVVRKAMAKAPADRFPDAAAFRDALLSPDLEAGARHAKVRRVRNAAVATAVGVAALLAVRFAVGAPDALDTNRVMVFPLVIPDGVPETRTLGEDVATMIGTVLDGIGPLRWIDGWSQLDTDRRQDARRLTLEDARRLARASGSAWFVMGRIVLRGEQVDVSLTLHEAKGQVPVATGSGTSDVAWRAGLRAVNGLLPALIPESTTGPVDSWADRNPAAVASFLLGEASFRRLALEDALGHYRRAVQLDSSFALAALRGAQVASWHHRPDEAASLVMLAVQQPLPARYAAFAHGYRHYLEGRADSAIAAFEDAVAEDRDMAVAWQQLGETYTHLLPATGSPEALAEAAFLEVRRLDPDATYALGHLSEIWLRRGDAERAAPLVERIREADDSLAAGKIAILFDCVDAGPDRMPWDEIARDQPFPLLAAAKDLAGSDLPCALAAATALLRGDTAVTDDAASRRYFAQIILLDALLAQDRTNEALASLDDYVARWGEGTSLYLIAAVAHEVFAERAREVARADAERFGADYRRTPFNKRLWALGVWAANDDHPDIASAVAGELAARAGAADDPHVRVMAESVRAHALLARGDTTAALRVLEVLVPAAVPTDLLSWDEALPLGAERLELARILMVRGDPARAIEIADVLDAAWPVIHPLYLRPGLELRARAAELLGERRLVTAYRARLDGLSSGTR